MSYEVIGLFARREIGNTCRHGAQFASGCGNFALAGFVIAQQDRQL